MNIRKFLIYLIISMAIISLSAGMVSCSLPSGSVPEQGKQGQEETQAEKDQEDSTGSESAEPDKAGEEMVEEEAPLAIWIEDIIPEDIKDLIKSHIDKYPLLEYASQRQDSDLVLEIQPAGGIDQAGGTSRELDITYVLVLAAPFFTIADGIGWEDFQAWWAGGEGALADLSGSNPVPVLAAGRQDRGLLEKILGEPGNENIIIAGRETSLLGLAGGDISFALVPFEHIDRQMKVMEISGLSVFDRSLEISQYPFAFAVSLKGNADSVSKAYDAFSEISYTNRDVSSMTTMIMTGVTAMVRGTAQRMENHGILYPGEKIADILKDADITHISNEVPFVEGCDVLTDRFPFFCSKPEYIELLEFVGTDVVELTGNHMNDHGHDWFLHTLQMYDEKGWPYFGGGRDLEESYSPAILESNGNRFAFLGFCWWGPAGNWAAEDSPGSAPPHFEEFEARIRQLRQEGYIVIFTFQYLESYQYAPVAQQVTDFRRMIDAGADIVSGSQSHHPQGMEFYGEGFINYGLGNLFFDQMRQIGTRQELIARHIFYKGEHINTVIITAMLEDYSQPRIATPQEREEILTEVFNASIR
jgi:hypothetical protein